MKQAEKARVGNSSEGSKATEMTNRNLGKDLENDYKTVEPLPEEESK